MDLSFAIAAGPSQRSHSHVRVPRDSWPHFTVSDSRLPQPGGLGPRIYIPTETGWPGYTPRHWVLLSSPPTPHRATVEAFDTASTWGRFLTRTNGLWRGVLYAVRATVASFNYRRSVGTVFSMQSLSWCYEQTVSGISSFEFSGVERVGWLMSELKDCCGSVLVSGCC
jgi:hypothetical protein